MHDRYDNEKDGCKNHSCEPYDGVVAIRASGDRVYPVDRIAHLKMYALLITSSVEGAAECHMHDILPIAFPEQVSYRLSGSLARPASKRG